MTVVVDGHNSKFIVCTLFCIGLTETLCRIEVHTLSMFFFSEAFFQPSLNLDGWSLLSIFQSSISFTRRLQIKQIHFLLRCRIPKRLDQKVVSSKILLFYYSLYPLYFFKSYDSCNIALRYEDVLTSPFFIQNVLSSRACYCRPMSIVRGIPSGGMIRQNINDENVLCSNEFACSIPLFAIPLKQKKELNQLTSCHYLSQ